MTHSSDINSRTDVSETVEAEALAWIAQLDGANVTPKDLAVFREWMNRSPAHSREIRELSGLWGELNVLTEMSEGIAVADLASSKMRKRPKNIGWRFKTGFATVAALSIFGLFSITQTPNLVQGPEIVQTAEVDIPRIYKTKIGEKQDHTLPDGSVISLNTGSSIEVEYREDQRRIRLLQGEVLFDVAHDKSRPFLVYAGDGIVRAVGTAFVVRLEGNLIDVMVSEGAVELSSVLPTADIEVPISENSKISSLGIIKAGHSAKYENAGASIASVSEEQMNAKLSWQNGLITFQGETLEEVIREVSRYTELDIQIKDQELLDLRLGGVFPSGDTQVLFETLKSNFDIKVDTDLPGRVYLSLSQ